ncbi:hypothetical protein RKD52_001188 [Metabacillus sp. SLBN-84]
MVLGSFFLFAGMLLVSADETEGMLWTIIGNNYFR